MDIYAQSNMHDNGAASSLDLLDDVDLMGMYQYLEQAEMKSTTRRRSSVRRGSMDQLELSISSLTELFPLHEGMDDNLDFLSDDDLAPVGNSALVRPHSSVCMSPDLKVRVPSRVLPAGFAIKSECIKSEFSPTMDAYLNESWAEIETPNSCQATVVTRPAATAGGRWADTSLFPSHTPGPVAMAVAVHAAGVKSNPKLPSGRLPRRAKECIEDGCGRRAQSNNRCKTHGGGARCQMEGCDKSSQGGGLCRAHGGGKKCRIPGCSKGTQRLGLCYLHGGIRRCIQEGCKKKDRGNGYCISHGGGRRCETPGCERSVRKGDHCQVHQLGDA